MTPFVITCILFPRLVNVIVVTYKRKKTLNKMIENFEEKGYKIDNRLKSQIPFKIIDKYHCGDYVDSNYFMDLALHTWFPIICWYSLYPNIKYLLGDYTGRNQCYVVLEDLSLDNDVISFLEKEELIKADLAKQMWLADNEYAMKELEKLEQKYDKEKINEKVKSSSSIEKYSVDELCEELKRRGLKKVEVDPEEAMEIFKKIEEEGILDKNNSIDEVYEKMKNLQEIVERRHLENQDNSNSDENKLTLRNPQERR